MSVSVKNKETGNQRQPTLAKFGFKRSLTISKGETFRLHMNEFAEKESVSKEVVCPDCETNVNRTFKSLQYLNNHVMYKHKDRDIFKNGETEKLYGNTNVVEAVKFLLQADNKTDSDTRSTQNTMNETNAKAMEKASERWRRKRS